jgi:signal transduction histidine kinase
MNDKPLPHRHVDIAHATSLALAVQHCDDGLIVVDETGRVSICNPRAIALLELSPGPADARPLLADLLQGVPGIEGGLRAGLAGSSRTAAVPPMAATFPNDKIVEIHAAPVPGGTVLTCRDVSASRQAQARLSECEAKFGALEEKFNEVIGTVMREVTERQNRANLLAAAKIAAEAATEAKSVFLSSMSHEVRTPLNGILGFTDLLLEGHELSGPSRKIADKIRSAGNALLSVVDDILDFSEIESGGVTLNRHDFSLTSMVNAALEMIEPQLLRKGLRLASVIDPSIASHIRGDEARLRQILLNILNNAVKFTTEGSIRVSVNRVATAGRRQTLRFDVADSGIGIPADKHGQLFERFSQIDASVRRKFGGTGLGLAISKHLVELMGGQISFESVEGQGSVFSFVLDLDIASASPPETRVEAVPALGGKRILLVEDIEVNSEIAQAMIEAAGYAVDVVADGLSAIAAVQHTRYDLVLMDIQMPEMDGVMAMQRIRSLNHPAATLPIVAMTAHVIPREVERFLAAGMNDHIGKPFKRGALHAKIAQWCAVDAPLAPVPNEGCGCCDSSQADHF